MAFISWRERLLFSWWKPLCWMKDPFYILFHRHLYTPEMSTNSSQVGSESVFFNPLASSLILWGAGMGLLGNLARDLHLVIAQDFLCCIYILYIVYILYIYIWADGFSGVLRFSPVLGRKVSGSTFRWHLSHPFLDLFLLLVEVGKLT